MDVIETAEWLIKSPFLCCGWLIIGTMAGALARRFMGSEDEPFWSDLLLGLAGAIVGGFIAGTVLGIDNDSGGLLRWGVTLVIAIGGAMLLLFANQKLRGRKRGKRRGKRRIER